MGICLLHQSTEPGRLPIVDWAVIGRSGRNERPLLSFDTSVRVHRSLIRVKSTVYNVDSTPRNFDSSRLSTNQILKKII